MADQEGNLPARKRTTEELRKLLHDAEIRLRDKKADKKSAMKCYNEDIKGYEDEIGDLLAQLEEGAA